jgi:hypothetical protein
MALKSLLLASVVTNDVAAERANPIRKVVNMLQAMQKKVEAEGERDKALFDKFMCYCKTGVGQLEKSVGDAQTKLPNVGSDIEESEASVVQMKQDLKNAQTDRSEAKAAMASATALRAKEAAGYTKESVELKTNIAAITKAVKAIQSGMGGAFLQTESAKLLKKIVQQADIYDVDRQDIMAFLSSSSDAEAPGTGQIAGILKTLADEMSADLKTLTADENESIKTFDQLMAAKTKEVQALSKEIETKLVRVGELAVSIVQMKNDLSDTEASLLEDQKFLKDIKKDCSTKADEYQEIVTTRQQELLALADTIKLLNDDDALELFKKTLPGASALLQVGVDVSIARESALTAVKRAQDAALNPRPRIDFIAMAIQGKKIGFEKVIKMIDEMVGTLKQEQLDDDHKKEYCAEQFDFADDKKKGLEQKINGLETTIIDAKDGITKLGEEIDGLEDQIKATDKQVAEMTEQRKDESKEYQELMASNGAAKELLGFAKNRLNKFYNPKLYKPEGAASFVQISMHKQEPPPEAPGAYKKKGEEGTGVIAMIDVLVKDLDKEMTESEVTEKNAQKDYEQFMADSTESRTEASKSLTNKMAAKADLKTDLETATEEEGASQKELMATESYISSLHAECDWLLKYFDMRTEARTGEIDSLNNAKAVLSGANFALIQTRSSNILRRSRQPSMDTAKEEVVSSQVFQSKVQQLCKNAPAEKAQQCDSAATDALFCQLLSRSKPDQLAAANCSSKAPAFIQLSANKAPEDDLAQEMTHDLEMNFNKIAPFGKEDTAKELQDHAAKTQDTLVDAVENAEVAEIKRAVFRALTRLRAATIKEFDTIARLETQAIDAYNDAHHYRAENPLTHLHEDEAPVETDKLKSFH